MGLIFKKSTAQPAFTVAAAITGTTEATQTLTCAYTVVRARAVNVTVRWYRHTADDGTDPTGVLLGTGTTYTLTGTDVGNYIRAIVTAINPAGTVQSTTSYTAVITSGDPPTPPTITSAAVITGTADVNETLTVTAGFDGETSITYQWYSYTTEPTGSPLTGTDEVELGTANTQPLTASEAGRWIVAVVTATNAAGPAVTSASVAMAGVDPYQPIAPTQYVVPDYDDSELEKIYANSGDDLQSKLNQLAPGKCLVIQAGVTWTGKYKVPRTNFLASDESSPWAYIITSDLAGLPAEGVRVNADDATHMPKLQNNKNNLMVLGVDDGVSKLRIVGLEITTLHNDFSVQQPHLAYAGKDESLGWATTYGEEIVFDRCYIHSNPEAGTKAGLVLYSGCGKVAVIGCHFEWFHGGSDANGVHVQTCPGPVLIHNNTIITAGECVFMCDNAGFNTLPEGQIPRDVTITKNFIAHRKEYDRTHPDYGYPGRIISTKNLIESKGSKRVLVRGNVFYYGRGDGSQQGCPWMHQNVGGDGVWDLDFRDNVAIDCGSITIANPFDNNRGFGYQRLRFQNNLFVAPVTTWASIYFGTNIPPADSKYITFKHNSWIYPGSSFPKQGLWFAQTNTISAAITGLLVEDNILRQGQYNIGIGAAVIGAGRAAPLLHCPGGFDFNNNVSVGLSDSQYTTTYDDWRNWYSSHNGYSSNTPVKFVNTAFTEIGHCALAADSPFKGAALDGVSDIGADIDAIVAQINSEDNDLAWSLYGQ